MVRMIDAAQGRGEFTTRIRSGRLTLARGGMDNFNSGLGIIVDIDIGCCRVINEGRVQGKI